MSSRTWADRWIEQVLERVRAAVEENATLDVQGSSSLVLIAELSQAVGECGRIAGRAPAERQWGVDPDIVEQGGEPIWNTFLDGLVKVAALALAVANVHSIPADPDHVDNRAALDVLTEFAGYAALEWIDEGLTADMAIKSWQLQLLAALGDIARRLTPVEPRRGEPDGGEAVNLETLHRAAARASVESVQLAGLAVLAGAAMLEQHAMS